MRQMTVHSCVKVLSQSVPQLPCHLMEDDNGIKNKAATHPLYRLIHDMPNGWQTAPEFWGMVVAHMSLRGDFIAYKVQSPGRPIQALFPISPDRIISVTQSKDYTLIYKISSVDGLQAKEYPQSQIFHVRGMTLNGIRGVNPIEHIRETVGMGLASERFLSGWFGKGMHPGAILKHPLTLNAPAHANLKKTFKEKYAGLGTEHEFMILDENMDITFPPINLVDAQFLELNRMTASQIAGIFRVPLILLQSDNLTTTFASAEQIVLAFATHALTPILVNIEKAIYRDLLTDQEKDKYYAKFSMAGLLRGDMATRYNAYQTAINACFLSPNECRSFEEMNNYEGGDEFRTRTSTTKDNSTSDDASDNSSDEDSDDDEKVTK
jgi:HK97 family phage portal protein